MQWLQATRIARSYQSGRAPWTTAGSPRSASWRWPAHHSGGLLIETCPLEEFCAARGATRPIWPEMGADARPGGAGSSVIWLGADDEPFP